MNIFRTAVRVASIRDLAGMVCVFHFNFAERGSEIPKDLKPMSHREGRTTEA